MCYFRFELNINQCAGGKSKCRGWLWEWLFTIWRSRWSPKSKIGEKLFLFFRILERWGLDILLNNLSVFFICFISGCSDARSPATATAAAFPDEHDERPLAVIQILEFLGRCQHAKSNISSAEYYLICSLGQQKGL